MTIIKYQFYKIFTVYFKFEFSFDCSTLISSKKHIYCGVTFRELPVNVRSFTHSAFSIPRTSA